MITGQVGGDARTASSRGADGVPHPVARSKSAVAGNRPWLVARRALLPVVTSLNGVAAHEPAEYRSGLSNPAGPDRRWSITATMAAQRGAAPLVPPTTNQPRRFPQLVRGPPAVQ